MLHDSMKVFIFYIRVLDVIKIFIFKAINANRVRVICFMDYSLKSKHGVFIISDLIVTVG